MSLSPLLIMPSIYLKNWALVVLTLQFPEFSELRSLIFLSHIIHPEQCDFPQTCNSYLSVIHSVIHFWCYSKNPYSSSLVDLCFLSPLFCVTLMIFRYQIPDKRPQNVTHRNLVFTHGPVSAHLSSCAIKCKNTHSLTASQRMVGLIIMIVEELAKAYTQADACNRKA